MEEKKQLEKEEGKFDCPYCRKYEHIRTIVHDSYDSCPVCGSNLWGFCVSCGSNDSPKFSLYCVRCRAPFYRAELEKFKKEHE